ncbi:hypothetical protein B0H14DRAFT_2639929 [Mycena olivaceomarginata]|nr:hypothetical protein B0H14DRAFT_2639929 [Mycena olivaceomarginata]
MPSSRTDLTGANSKAPANLDAQILDRESSLAALQLKSELDPSIRSNFESSLSKFQSERTLVQERLVSYKYPILLSPNEIVAEIFAHYFVPVYPLCPPLADLLSPAVLTLICRQWRAVAMEYPTLWRGVSLSASSIPVNRPLLFDSNAHGIAAHDIKTEHALYFTFKAHLEWNQNTIGWVIEKDEVGDFGELEYARRGVASW